MSKTIRQLIPREDFLVLAMLSDFQYIYGGGESVECRDTLRLVSLDETRDRAMTEVILFTVRQVLAEGNGLRLRGIIHRPQE